MNFSLFYRKIKNKSFFDSLENSEIGVNNLQNYIPIYHRFFSLNENNYNNINLNSIDYIVDYIKYQNNNTITVKMWNEKKKKNIEKNIFIKYCPLIDALKYIIGKYDANIVNIIPSLENKNIDMQINDYNNSAYIDGFMCYLISNLLNCYDFINGINYFGSFIGIKDNFEYDIIDDIEILHNNSYFYKNNNKLFDLPENFDSNCLDDSSRKHKNKIKISKDLEVISLDSIDSDIVDVFGENTTCKENVIFNLNDIKEIENLGEPVNKIPDDESSISSKSSCTCDENNEENSCFDDESDDDESDNSDEDKIMVKIRKFPVQLLCMEKCTNTLDYLMMEEDLSEAEWCSALFQIVVMLYTYQKAFNFTHNDLHTNNVMYIETPKEYIYYHIEGSYYKVPTFGKIFKLIDFGRSIFKFQNNIFCSDCYRPNGEASTQYNCEPYFNNKKPKLEPNMSFDLCRLSCSIFDYFIDDLEEVDEMLKKSAAFRIIYKWLLDDKGRNILYKKNGEERYPEFKLYKMIARTVHNHVPKDEIKRNEFASYKISRKKINKKAKVIFIDNIPSMI
jgi:hypothetical protein